MADKDGDGFFRKVARLVANPVTEWSEFSTRPADSAAPALEQSELKAMIERKRRNDFVRKREFDMLRRLRREGLSPEQLAALGGSSRLEDPEARHTGAHTRPMPGMVAKIDEIEQQMVDDGFMGGRRPTVRDAAAFSMPASFKQPSPAVAELPSRRSSEPPPRPAVPPMPGPQAGLPLVPLPSASLPLIESPSLEAMEVNEVVQDPALDDAVFAFANADFGRCEQVLDALTGPGGARAQHPETWLVRLDLYRATGDQTRFEALAAQYAERFGCSPPQWFSLPRLVAEATAAQQQGRSLPPPSSAAAVSWSCPAKLDAEAAARLDALCRRLPLPWVFDWSPLQTVEPGAAMPLRELFQHWATQSVHMRWLGGVHLLQCLRDVTPTGARATEPALWLLRMEALRLAHRAEAFDEAAIDYCITYEVSPPSWEPPRCRVQIDDGAASTLNTTNSTLSETSHSFFESSLQGEGPGRMAAAHLELSGQLVGDIGGLLERLEQQLGPAMLVHVHCTRLIRVDFIAAGDLLNWVLSRRGEGRSMAFLDSHRLVALFFGAMGITEHAQVRVRNV